MPLRPPEQTIGETPRPWRVIRNALAWLFRSSAGRSHLFIVGSGVLVCAYALGVICCVLSVPDIGVRCTFTPEVDHFFPEFLYPEEQEPLQTDDVIDKLGGHPVENWPQFLRGLAALRDRPEPTTVTSAAQLKDPQRQLELARLDGEEIVRVEFTRNGRKGVVWCRLGHSPLAALVPTVLWFFIKAGLFLVGALVFWTRPQERSARLFFVLCIVSCGAYLGGYHWQSITTRPPLLLVFMASAVLLPPVSLHFYLLFPRPKPFFARRPRLTLTGVYALPLLFLVLLLLDYLHVRLLMAANGGGELVNGPLQAMLFGILGYFLVALILYLLSIWALVHGYRTARDVTERNQVKWILIGATAALVPLGYSLYLALLDQNRFGGGGATWPMFGASLCVTLAFTISITRYRLMQLDQIVSSGFVYFAISVMAAAVYYALVFGGVLLLGSRIIGGPSLAQAASVGTTVLLLLVGLDVARGRLKKVLDRHFRREKLHLDRTLQRMSQAVAQLVDAPTLARHLLQATSDLLGVERGAVYLRDGDPSLYRLAAQLGEPPRLPELPPGSSLVEELRSHGSLYPRPPHGNGNGTAHDPFPAWRQLRSLGGEVAFALVHEERMLALLVLGPKSDGPYTSEDLNLLSAFSQVTVLALVSGESGRTIEGLNRELQEKIEEIAEKQRRILALQSQLTRRQRTSEEGVRSQESGVRSQESAAGPSSLTPDSCPLTPETEILGTSPAVNQLLYQVRKVAASSSPVLLRGESGTGKDLLARAVHANSPRAGRPFVKVHCAALQQTLLESELFGHVKGAYTGAVRDREGRFELAHGGTLFLDEIGDVSWEVQTKLLRVLQEMTFERVGSSEPIQVDVRIIAATHQDLEGLIRQGRFREDLFYRLNVLPILVPPLRARREDIVELVQHFLRYHGQRSGKGDVEIDDDALALLKAAPWPGNVRQLGSVIERAVVIAEGPLLTVADLPAELLASPAEEEAGNNRVVEAAPLLGGVQAERAERDRRERQELVRALAATSGNKTEAARILGLARSTFLSRLKKHGLS